MATARRRCACRRVLLGADLAPVVEALSTVERLRHALEACETYRLMARGAPADGTWRRKRVDSE